MEEHKKKALWREKLSGLKRYQTSSDYDHQMAEALDKLAWHTQLEKSLPHHIAPDSWPQIEEALRATKVPNRKAVLNWVLAVLIILGGIIFFWRWHQMSHTNTLIHYEVAGEELALDREARPWMYFDAFCREHQIACDWLYLEELRTDWDATVLALYELKESMGLYGKEEHLMEELNRLEAEYAAFVNRLLNALLS